MVEALMKIHLMFLGDGVDPQMLQLIFEFLEAVT